MERTSQSHAQTKYTKIRIIPIPLPIFCTLIYSPTFRLFAHSSVITSSRAFNFASRVTEARRLAAEWKRSCQRWPRQPSRRFTCLSRPFRLAPLGTISLIAYSVFGISVRPDSRSAREIIRKYGAPASPTRVRPVCAGKTHGARRTPAHGIDGCQKSGSAAGCM